MQGYDADDPVCAERAAEPVASLLQRGAEGLRIAVAGGYFKCRTAETVYAVDRVAAALGANRDIDIPQAERARSAAYHRHRERGRKPAPRPVARARPRFRPGRARPADRGRHAAGLAGRQGAEIPPLVSREVLKLFAEVDAILAPATPCTAPLIGQQTFMFDGVEIPLRPNLGVYTQPISFIGVPVVAVPVPLSPLPIGVQIIAAPWREDVALRIAHALEAQGVVAAMRPTE